MPYESFAKNSELLLNGPNTDLNRLSPYFNLLNLAHELNLILKIKINKTKIKPGTFRSYSTVYHEFYMLYRNYYGDTRSLDVNGGLGLIDTLDGLVQIRQSILQKASEEIVSSDIP